MVAPACLCIEGIQALALDRGLNTHPINRDTLLIFYSHGNLTIRGVEILKECCQPSYSGTGGGAMEKNRPSDGAGRSNIFQFLELIEHLLIGGMAVEIILRVYNVNA